MNNSDDENSVSFSVEASTTGNTGSVFQRLFGPTADILGAALARMADKKLSVKQQSNLALHVEKAKTQSPTTTVEPDLGQIADLMSWADGAKDVDPDLFQHTSILWQDALVSIRDGRSGLLRALQRIPPSSIESFHANGALTLDDAIAFEKAGLGVLCEPSRFFTKSSGVTVFYYSIITSTVGIAVLLFISSITLYLSISSIFTSVLLAVAASAVFAGAAYELVTKTKYKRLFPWEHKFWLSSLGQFTVTQIFGHQGTTLLNISPVEIERADEYTQANPTNRDFYGTSAGKPKPG